MPEPRLTDRVHALLSARLQPGDCALDATCGAGRDTALLAARVGAGGRVWAIDCQREALQRAQVHLGTLGLRGRVAWVEGDHAQLAALLPAHLKGGLAAAVFNLGYLPGGARGVTTQAATTRTALEAAWAWLKPGGVLSVVAYRGHPGGLEEARAVAAWAQALEDCAQLELWDSTSAQGPIARALIKAV